MQMDQNVRRAAPVAPKQIQIEITTRCNLTCVMCPHGLPNGMPSKRDADPDLITRALANLDNVERIHPTGTGEPLMAEGFWRIIDELQGRSAPLVTFHTNGLLMTDRAVERIMGAPVRHIVVSMDAATDETHQKIRGANFSRVTQAVRRLSTASKAANRYLLLECAMVLMVENYREAPAFVELAHELGASAVNFTHLMNPNRPWSVSRGDFKFEYADQRIVASHPLADDSDAHVVQAIDRADELGIKVNGLNLFAKLDAADFKDRPSRSLTRSRYT
ncbi:MAG: radical SAM protein [Mesorhizobium sp.]|nr:radical SAM protein [Mesorhizobium sp.]